MLAFFLLAQEAFISSVPIFTPCGLQHRNPFFLSFSLLQLYMLVCHDVKTSWQVGGKNGTSGLRPAPIHLHYWIQKVRREPGPATAFKSVTNLPFVGVGVFSHTHYCTPPFFSTGQAGRLLGFKPLCSQDLPHPASLEEVAWEEQRWQPLSCSQK